MFIFCHILEKSIKCLQRILDEIVQKGVASKFVSHISIWINRGTKGRTKDGVMNKESAKTIEGWVRDC
jgi:hypothetical protein